MIEIEATTRHWCLLCGENQKPRMMANIGNGNKSTALVLCEVCSTELADALWDAFSGKTAPKKEED